MIPLLLAALLGGGPFTIQGAHLLDTTGHAVQPRGTNRGW